MKEINKLGKLVTRPNQELIIIRGIPGAGKSTKAKELVGSNGKIHSTDSIIEATGDYRGFFSSMVETKDFSPLSNAHSLNVLNAIESINQGFSPVILDNTNIKQNDPKKMVEKALEMGLSDSNIKIVDIGTNGLSANQLFERNTHGVPLAKIKSMIDSHKGQGVLTLDNILSSKDLYSNSDILYSEVVLDDLSKNNLLSAVKDFIPDGWVIFAHHMTIAYGKDIPKKEDIGLEVSLNVTDIGSTDMVLAVKVDGYESTNDVAHITIAVNPNGGRPVMSNDITEWEQIKRFKVKGTVNESSMKTNPK